MAESNTESVIVAVPFSCGYGGWDAQIDSCIDMEIERLESEEEVDEASLASLNEDDFHRDEMYDRIAKDYVEAFNRIVREEAGVELFLEYRSRDEFSIYADMPMKAASGLMQRFGTAPLDADEWEAQICKLLPNDGEDVSETVFTFLAEHSDSFFP